MLQDEISTNLKYIPIKNARKDVPFERIYLQLLNELMVKSPGELLNCLNITHSFKQRSASVVASFVVYMGCNVGKNFTREAIELANSKLFHSSSDAFLAAWAIFNKRQSNGTSVIRPSEVMLSSEYIFENNRINWNRVPSVTQEDNDVIEGMVNWWSSKSGEIFRQKAQKIYELELMEQ